MYTVVLCPDCQFVWIVNGQPDRTSCQRCQSSHKFGKIRHLKRVESNEEAREWRTALWADINGRKEEFEEVTKQVDIFEDRDLDVDHDEVFEKYGVNKDEVEEASDVKRKKSQSDRDVITSALEDLENPSTDEVVSYASERGVGEEKTLKVIEKLRRSGQLIRKNGGLNFV